MSSTIGSSLADPQLEDCRPPSRFWRIPATILGALAAALIGFLLLVWAGILRVPSFGGGSPPFWLVFPLGFLLFWLVLLLAVRPWPWRGSWGRGYGWYPAGDAREIVRVRYARGEISREEMASILRDLDGESRTESGFAVR